jgi:hypothetical protein
MKDVKEYRTVDKSSWGGGPWENEPDKIQWTDGETGLPCLAVRQPEWGHWCGYVGVSSSHPWHRKDYGACALATKCKDDYCQHSPGYILEAHGGITYANECADGPEERAVCHVPKEGEPDDIWWFGFDCAHYGDVLPGRAADPVYKAMNDCGMYRSLRYVQANCARIAEKLVEVAK